MIPRLFAGLRRHSDSDVFALAAGIFVFLVCAAAVLMQDTGLAVGFIAGVSVTAMFLFAAAKAFGIHTGHAGTAKAEHEALERAKDEFISFASHQLRTPLTAISWYAESVADGDYGALTKKQLGPVTAIRDSSHRMAKLINAILNVSRVETGNVRIIPVPVNLRELVDEVLSETVVDQRRRNVDVRCLSTKTLPTILTDRSLVKIVIQNLITNAIKYTPAGGRVTIGLRKDGSQALVSIADTGIGIPQAEQPNIFEKMYRAKNAGKAEIDGTGIGLYIAKAIVRRFGGKIWFDSKEGAGTTFSFTLPLHGAVKQDGMQTLVADF